MYHWPLFFHVIFAMFWIGGMLFTGAVLVPSSHHSMFQHRRGEFFILIGTRFSRISWIIFLLMIVTGILTLLGKGFTAESLFSAGFWQSGYGNTLRGKLHIFGFVLVVSGIHDFWLGPKAAVLMDTTPGHPKTERYRKLSGWLGRINLLLGLVILWYALQLVR